MMKEENNNKSERKQNLTLNLLENARYKFFNIGLGVQGTIYTGFKKHFLQCIFQVQWLISTFVNNFALTFTSLLCYYHPILSN